MCAVIQIPTIYGRLNFGLHKFCCVGVQCCFDRPRVREGPPVPVIKRFFFPERKTIPSGSFTARKQRDRRTEFDTRCTSGTKENYSGYPMPLCW